MENKQETLEQQQPQGWADVHLHGGLSVNALIDFLNILNQRVCTIENIVSVPDAQGKHHSLTEIYREQEKAMQQAQNQNQPTESAE